MIEGYTAAEVEFMEARTVENILHYNKRTLIMFVNGSRSLSLTKWQKQQLASAGLLKAQGRKWVPHPSPRAGAESHSKNGGT